MFAIGIDCMIWSPDMHCICFVFSLINLRQHRVSLSGIVNCCYCYCPVDELFNQCVHSVYTPSLHCSLVFCCHARCSYHSLLPLLLSHLFLLLPPRIFTLLLSSPLHTFSLLFCCVCSRHCSVVFRISSLIGGRVMCYYPSCLCAVESHRIPHKWQNGLSVLRYASPLYFFPLFTRLTLINAVQQHVHTCRVSSVQSPYPNLKCCWAVTVLLWQTAALLCFPSLLQLLSVSSCPLAIFSFFSSFASLLCPFSSSSLASFSHVPQATSKLSNILCARVVWMSTRWREPKYSLG